MIKVQRIRDCRVLSPKWDITNNLDLPKFMDHCRRRGRIIVVKPEAVDGYNKTVLARHNKQFHL